MNPIKLEKLIEEYKKGCIRRKCERFSYYKSFKTLPEAVKEAALASGNGKRTSHQRRIPKKSLNRSKTILKNNISMLRKSKDFDSLYDSIDKLTCKVFKLGDLYVYDTALRIGVYLNLLPKKVYLHAGTKIGERNLGLSFKSPYILIRDIPKPFKKLKPYQIEDFLCIYKDRFKNGLIKVSLSC